MASGSPEQVMHLRRHVAKVTGVGVRRFSTPQDGRAQPGCGSKVLGITAVATRVRLVRARTR